LTNLVFLVFLKTNRFPLFTFLNAMEVFVIHFMANCVHMTRRVRSLRK